MTWIRFGLAATIAGTAIVGMGVAAGCGGGDNSGGGGGMEAGMQDHSVTDSPVTPETGGQETGVHETGADVEAGPVIPNAKVYLVHAATSPLAPPFRFCFGLPTGDASITTPSGFDPFPDTVLSPAFKVAGLYPGFGGSVTDSPKIKVIDLSTIAIALFAIDATKIAGDTADGGPDGGAEVPCEQLIGTTPLSSNGSLKLGTDYWYVGSVAKGTFLKGTTWLAAVTGCPPGEDPTNAAFCPQPYDMTNGNLTLKTFQVDNTTAVADGGMIGAQFANTSSAWDTVLTLNSGVATAAGFWSIVPITGDAGTTTEGGTEAGTSEAGPGEAGPGEGGASEGGASEAGQPEAGGMDASLEGGQPPATELKFTPITTSGSFGTLSPMKLVSEPLPAYGNTAGFFASMVGADGGTIYAPPACIPGETCGAPLLLPLPSIDQLTYGGAAPMTGSFVAGHGYVFILVGNPYDYPFVNPLDGGQSSQEAGVFNSKSGHFLAFPTSNP
jgi:hypothetical protein